MSAVFSSWRQLIPADFAPDSRVWIYQSSRMFFLAEALQIEPMLEAFAESWKSHGAPVKGYANLLFGQFIVLIADETATGVSGCSTDSSVRLIKDIENKFQVNLFDRQTLAFLRNEKVELIPLSQFSHAVAGGLITPDTPYFNNLAQTKDELLHQWIIPVKQSWLARRFPLLKEDFC